MKGQSKGRGPIVRLTLNDDPNLDFTPHEQKRFARRVEVVKGTIGVRIEEIVDPVADGRDLLVDVYAVENGEIQYPSVFGEEISFSVLDSLIDALRAAHDTAKKLGFPGKGASLQEIRGMRGMLA